MIAVFASHAGKAIVQNAAVQVTANHLPNVWTVESILPLKPVLVDWHKYRHLSEMVSKALSHSIAIPMPK